MYVKLQGAKGTSKRPLQLFPLLQKGRRAALPTSSLLLPDRKSHHSREYITSSLGNRQIVFICQEAVRLDFRDLLGKEENETQARPE